MSVALIETVRVRNGEAPLWYLHLRRLANSCIALGIPLPGELLPPAGGEDRIQRFEVSRKGVELSERPVGSLEPVRLVTSSVAHRAYPHKTTERGQFDRALEDARSAGADDALLLTVGGYVAETAIWGLFWWEDGLISAPAVELGVLPGVARARVAELVGRIAERRVQVEHLRGRSLFVANAARGVVPVASLDGDRVPQEPQNQELVNRFWS
jgi:branched-subunit amino acid aminotransferase/4-amino-4-deoxychorismate lyase